MPVTTFSRILLALIVWLLLLCCFASRAQPRRNPITQAATVKWLLDRLSVREATARPGNDGPAVAAIITAGGGAAREHPEWCGFTQAADQRAHGLPIPGGGLQGAARYWFVDARRQLLPRAYFYAGRRGVLDSIQRGDLVGFAWRGSPDIHHIVRADELVPPLRRGRAPRGVWSWGGNEGRWPDAGMHRSMYPGPNVTAASRWDHQKP